MCPGNRVLSNWTFMRKALWLMAVFVALNGPTRARANPARNARSLPDLESVERQALLHSIEMKTSRIDARIARAQHHSAWRTFLPSVSVSYRRNRTVARRNFDNGRYSAQLNISQPVYDGGRSSQKLKKARIEQSMLQSRREQLGRKIRLEAKEYYLNIQRILTEISIQKSSLNRSTRMLRRARMKLKRGLITPLEYTELENRQRGIQIQLDSSRRRLSRAIQDLCLLTGSSPEHFSGIRLLNLETLTIHSDHLNPRQIQSKALNNHPQILNARRSLELARKDLQVAEDYYLPRIALTARYGKTGEEWPPETAEWGLGFSISFRGLNSTLSNDLSIQRSSDKSRAASSGGTLDLFNDMNRESRILRSQKQLLRQKRKLNDLRKSIPALAKRLLLELNEKTRRLELQYRLTDNQKDQFNVDAIRYRQGELSLEEYREEELRMNQRTKELAKVQEELLLFVARMEYELGLPLDSLNIVDYSYLSSTRSAKRYREALQNPDSPE